jgi:hypothetical protein
LLNDIFPDKKKEQDKKINEWKFLQQNLGTNGNIFKEKENNNQYNNNNTNNFINNFRGNISLNKETRNHSKNSQSLSGGFNSLLTNFEEKRTDKTEFSNVTGRGRIGIELNHFFR